MATAWRTRTALRAALLLMMAPIAVVMTSLPAAAGAKSGAWTAAGSMSTPHGEEQVSLLVGAGRVLARGPYNYDFTIGNVDIYDPQTNGWSLAAKLDKDAVGASTTRLSDGRALLAGGSLCCNPEGPNPPPIKSALIYDPVANTWSPAGDMINARRNHTATLLPSGIVLVAGGFDRTVTYPNTSVGIPVPEVKDYALASAELYDPASKTWRSAGKLATARSGHTAIPLPRGKVLVIGGVTFLQDGKQKILDSAELYDPATNSWSTAGNMLTARSGYAATQLSDGRVLVVGGLGPDGPPALNSAELYDPASNSWSRAANARIGRAYHTATLLNDGRVLVAGGVDRGGRLATTEVFDPGTGFWTLVSSMATSRSHHQAVLLPSGKVLVIGGRSPTADLASAELYDPDGTGTPTSPTLSHGSGSWASAARMATGRGYRPTAVVLKDGRVAVLGGSPGQSSIDFYNRSTNAWASDPIPPETPGDPTVTLLKDGRLLLIGGQDSNGEGQTAISFYDRSGGTWTHGASMPSGRWGHLAVLLHDGRVLVVGGTDSHRNLGPLLYDPVANAWQTASSFPERNGTLPNTWSATALRGGQVLVTTTAVGPGETPPSGFVFEPNTNTWSAVGTMTIARTDYTATLLSSGAVLFAGGIVMERSGDRTIAKSSATAELWDPVSRSFRVVASMSKGRVFHTATLLPDSRVLVVGGAAGDNYGGDPLASCELYNPIANTWSPAASLAAARRTHASILLADGRVLTVGGLGLFDTLADAEIYTPAKLAVPGGAPPRMGGLTGPTATPLLETLGRWRIALAAVAAVVGVIAVLAVLRLKASGRLRRKPKQL